ncbi:MAG: Protein FecR [Pseudomonas citronellolis]|nr:MAG: Protein FecR [Pseudomonas citronellolis]
MSASERLDHTTLEQAADWFARLQAAPDDRQLHANWSQWLDSAASHRQAWQYIERVSQRFASLQEQGPAAHQTLASLRAGKRSRRQLLGLFGSLGSLGVLGWLGWRGAWRNRLDTVLARYRSGTGDIREERLADGSHLWLNSDSALDVELGASERLLRLYAGEVLIESGHDPRPLHLLTPAGRLTPLGTRFSVRLEGDATRLSVFDGAVRLECAHSGQRLTLSAGQAARFTADTAEAPQAAEVRREAWRRGLLLAEDMPLSQFVDELAGYRHGHLGLDPAIADLRVMGSFPLRDTDQALAQLQEVLPVRVVQRWPWWTTVEAR